MQTMPESRKHLITVPATLAGKRLDQALAELFPDYSRTRIKEWILAGRVLVDNRPSRPRSRVEGGEQVALEAVMEAPRAAAPQPIPLEVVHEDAGLLVINKPPGMVVHPGAGNPDSTLQNALLHHAPELSALPRAGIIHRLDKDTSGLLVVARSLQAHAGLVRAMEAREIQREYEALATGILTAGGIVDQPIGRHPVDRLRMAVRADGRAARTRYRVVRRFRGHTHLRVQLETGRTHQIRVHLAYLRHPLVGDRLYGQRLRIPAGATQPLVAALRAFRRQALHAGRLALSHPNTGEFLEWRAPPPTDLSALLETLARDAERQTP